MAPTIDLDCPPEKLKRMTGKIRTYWEGIGKKNAFWSVLTNEKYLEENLNGNIDEFYASGAAIAQQALSRIDNPGPCRGLELGCGTGRVSLHLAAELKELVACDISRPHLDLAQQQLHSRTGGNVQFENILEPSALLELGLFDFIFSVITLQHNPPPVIGQYIQTFCSILRPGGIAFFQIPTAIDNYRFATDEYLSAEELVMEMHMFPAQAVLNIAADARCEIIDQFELDMVGSKTVLSEIFVLKKA